MMGSVTIPIGQTLSLVKPTRGASNGRSFSLLTSSVDMPRETICELNFCYLSILV
jgi:hypothetical protein